MLSIEVNLGAKLCECLCVKVKCWGARLRASGVSVCCVGSGLPF